MDPETKRWQERPIGDLVREKLPAYSLFVSLPAAAVFIIWPHLVETNGWWTSLAMIFSIFAISAGIREIRGRRSTAAVVLALLGNGLLFASIIFAVYRHFR